MRRLGPAGGLGEHRRIVRPILDPSELAAGVDVGELPSSRLLLAVARRNEADADSARAEGELRCRVRLLPRDRSARVLAELELGTEPGWVETEVRVDATSGARLAFSCPPAAGPVDWARPLALPEERGSPGRLLVLVSLDTLRADRVAGFGAPRGRTPNLQQLGDEGLRLTGAVANGSWTVPSHRALLFSGLGPRQSLANHLAQRGFATVALVDGGYVSRTFGFHNGFDVFAPPPEFGASSFAGTLENARHWIERAGDAPLFLFIHTYAVHDPPPGQPDWERAPWNNLVPTEIQTRDAVAYYERLVAGLDEDLGGFFRFLRGVARTRPVLLVVTADHGEAFMEHGFYGHGSNLPLYDEVIRIPMIVWAPGEVETGSVDDRTTSLLDVAPSMLAAAATDGPPAPARGRNLWNVWRGGRSDAPELDADWPITVRNKDYWALRSRAWKLLVGHARGVAGPVRPRQVELFDLAEDPEERSNLASEQTGLAGELDARLDERLVALHIRPVELSRFRAEELPNRWRRPPEHDVDGVDDETLQELKALGYVE